MDPLATTADLDTLSRETWTDANADAAATLLAAASGVVRGYCGWSVSAVTDYTVTLDGPGGRTLALPIMGLATVTDVKIPIDGTFTSITDYSVSAAGILHRLKGWPAGDQNIQVTHSGGLDPVPAEIVAVVVSLVDRYVTQPTAVLRDIAGRVSRFYGPEAGSVALTKAERDVLGPYRITRDT